MQKYVLKNKIRALLLAISCLGTAPVASVYAADESFVAHTPNVLVTPDNLPVLIWDDPGVDTEIDPSDLNTLELCTPGACPQEALDAGAAYYQITDTLMLITTRKAGLSERRVKPLLLSLSRVMLPPVQVSPRSNPIQGRRTRVCQ